MDLQQYLHDTRDLVDAGEYAEALERHLWFHHHALEHDESMLGVRLSFALGDWMDLGKSYPPALEALEKLREAKTQQLLAGSGDARLFHDVVALNRAFAEEERTMALFEAVIASRPDDASAFWQFAKETVMKFARFDLARHYLKNPHEEYDTIVALYEEIEQMDVPAEQAAYLREYNRNRFVKDCMRLLHYAKAEFGAAEAETLRQKAKLRLQDVRLDAEI